MRKIKVFSLLLAVAMTCAAFVGCAGNADAGVDTIKIGLIAPLTGDVAVYGMAARNGAELFVNELNEAGGIDGKEVELIMYDDKGDATEAVNAYNKLVTSDEVLAIIGAVTSTPTIAVAQTSVADNVPLLTPTATHEDVTSYGNNMFRSCFIDALQGISMATMAVDSLNAKTAAIIYNDSDAYSKGLMESFTAKAEELGLEIVATEAYATGDVDYKAQLTNIMAASPEVIFVPDYYNTVYKIAQQAKEMGNTARLLGVDGVDGVLSIEGADASCLEGMRFSNHYDVNDPSELVQNFRKAFEDAYGEVPNAFASLGYDGAKILCAAIEGAINDGVDPEPTADFYQAVIDKLDATDIVGVTGPITYDENNNPQKVCAIIEIVNGEYSFVGSY